MRGDQREDERAQELALNATWIVTATGANTDPPGHPQNSPFSGQFLTAGAANGDLVRALKLNMWRLLPPRVVAELTP
ncbi:hypothetical protein GCM10023217_31970 [Gordonia alkaliphila]|uniref:Uncharacterized protein n=1 Tax=Gordonia alkaliphila TaxID=1053547 RepID=A0ABP8ZIR5_9ACTN